MDDSQLLQPGNGRLPRRLPRLSDELRRWLMMVSFVSGRHAA